MEQQLVTIVIPIYNVEAYLDRCIQSVVDQTYTHLEIILVDDGSTDGCPALCDQWAARDDRIQVIHKENAGLGMARNSGIDAASGEYVFFLDSDDYLDISTVQMCIRAADEFGAGAVLFGANDVFDDGRIVESKLHPQKFLYADEEILSDLLPGLFTYKMGYGISACMKMFNLSVIKQAGIRFKSERDIISEDAVFALDFFREISKAVVLDENFYYYFKRSNSLTSTVKADRQIGNDKFLQYCTKYIKDNGLPEELLIHITCRYHMYTMAFLRQLAAANAKDKKRKIFELLSNVFLRSTLRLDVLKHEKKSLRFFYFLLRCRCFHLCYIVLYVRARIR
ncbi:MAG: glycosyltransferase family 2 protein [Clostridia bacterium]|nr:glycosyltransferase family 2 protein [Clostridia bacterium]